MKGKKNYEIFFWCNFFNVHCHVKKVLKPSYRFHPSFFSLFHSILFLLHLLFHWHHYLIFLQSIIVGFIEGRRGIKGVGGDAVVLGRESFLSSIQRGAKSFKTLLPFPSLLFQSPPLHPLFPSPSPPLPPLLSPFPASIIHGFRGVILELDSFDLSAYRFQLLFRTLFSSLHDKFFIELHQILHCFIEWHTFFLLKLIN